jgi:CRP-like cAMP-binding protein
VSEGLAETEMREKLRGALVEHHFTRGLPDGLLDELVRCTVGVVNWQPDQVVFREGQKADRFYLILRGDVALELHSPGSPPRIIQTVNGDEVLGWSWLFAPFRWTFDARALTPTEAIELDGEMLRGDTGPEIDVEYRYMLMAGFAKLMADRLQATRLQLMDLYANRT